ncbi:MAG: mxcK [Rhodospirillales bacterium]|nr:mxcK [Rhodospirillales bacterium]
MRVNLFGSPERRLVILCGSVSFVSGMVFSMVTSLAPMLAHDLGIPAQGIGPIMGVYMIAASVSGFLGTLYLDRFDRRKGLFVGMLGVVTGLLATALAPNEHLLLAARMLTGIFAGPANAFSVAIIIDNVPLERRGRALGSIAGFGALAQIIGIPAGLEIADLFNSWRYPFFAIALVGSTLAVWVAYNLPPQRAHLENATSFAIRQRLRLLGGLLSRPICLLAYGSQLTGIVPLVAITAIMAVFLVNNLGYPSTQLSALYLIGGLTNIAAARVVGQAIDNVGPGIVSVVSTVLLTIAILMAYMGFNPGLPWIAVFALFFITTSGRLVVGQTIITRIPKPSERAGFQALASSIQSMSMGLSAMAIPVLLGSTPDGKLTGVNRFATVTIAVSWIFPFLVYRLNTLLTRREKAEAQLSAMTVPAE